MRGLVPLILLALAGVGCTKPTPVPARPPVVLTCSPPPQVHRPRLPIHDLKPGAPPDQVALAYAQSIRLLQGYCVELEALLDAHRPPRKP